jgi:hypothetical protein
MTETYVTVSIGVRGKGSVKSRRHAASNHIAGIGERAPVRVHAKDTILRKIARSSTCSAGSERKYGRGMQRENESRAYVECPKPDSRPGGPDYACNTSLERRHRRPSPCEKTLEMLGLSWRLAQRQETEAVDPEQRTRRWTRTWAMATEA